MKINLIVHPKALGGATEIRSTNKKNKAWVKLGNWNGHYYLQFHTANNQKSSFIHETKDGYITENNLKMPKYIMPLISFAEKLIKTSIS